MVFHAEGVNIKNVLKVENGIIGAVKSVVLTNRVLPIHYFIRLNFQWLVRFGFATK
jgi:hypothetical protein